MDRAITTRLGTLTMTILAALSLMGARECELTADTPDASTEGDGSPDGGSPGDEANCIDGIDNDEDGVTDCDDLDCARDPACWDDETELCGDRVDNDGDGLIDCGDDDCAADPTCAPVGTEDACDDDIDNDRDGATDCADDDCAADDACSGFGDTEVCDDTVDNDGDGAVDCDDPECARDPACYDSGESSEAPCDVVTQDCAIEAERCYPGGATAAEGFCFIAGDRGLGEPCIEPPLDEPEACSEGLVCLYPSEDAPEGTCYQLCGTAAGCGEGFQCHALAIDSEGTPSTDWGVCDAYEFDCDDGVDNDGDGDTDCIDPDCGAEMVCTGCDPFAQNCPDAADMCIVHDAAIAECVAEGTRTAGQTCSSPTACARGLQCAAISGMDPTTDLYWFTFNESYLARGPGYCLPLCHSGDASLCGDGEVCSPVSNSWDGSPRAEGVCFEPYLD
jgi:hypothetical protein